MRLVCAFSAEEGEERRTQTYADSGHRGSTTEISDQQVCSILTDIVRKAHLRMLTENGKVHASSLPQMPLANSKSCHSRTLKERRRGNPSSTFLRENRL